MGEQRTIVVKLTPKAASDRVGAWREDAHGVPVLQVAVTAAPENGKANAAMLQLLATYFDLPASALHVVRGAKGRTKVIRVDT